MAKRLFIIQTDQDLTDLISFCLGKNFSVWSQNGLRILPENELSIMSCNMRFYILPAEVKPVIVHSGSHSHIPFDTAGVVVGGTIINENGLCGAQGSVCLKGNNAADRHIYSILVRFIKESYHKSSDATFYVAPVLYKKWCAGLASFQFFVDAVSFQVPESEMDFAAFLNTLASLGYTIRAVGHDIRNTDQAVNPKAESYIIHTHNAKLHSWIAARRMYYFTDSECVFLYRKRIKRLEVYCIVADQRHFHNGISHSSVEQVYTTLLKKYNAGRI